jgi:hypothetical protein
MTTKDFYLKAYTQQKSNAKQRGVEFAITFDEWKQVWIDSGKWGQRGRGAEKYCMCRIGDVGCYKVGNVFVGLGKHNVRDGNLGKLDSDETKRKKSEAMRGKSHPWSAGSNSPMHRPEVKAKLSASISGSKHYSARMVGTPHGIWGSAVECAKALRMPEPTVNWRCRNQKLGFAYLT